MNVVINAVKIDETTTLEYATNPKRPGFKAHARYEQYSAATSIKEYFELCDEPKYARADLRYDEEHGHLKLIDAEGNQLNATDK